MQTRRLKGKLGCQSFGTGMAFTARVHYPSLNTYRQVLALYTTYRLAQWDDLPLAQCMDSQNCLPSIRYHIFSN